MPLSWKGKNVLTYRIVWYYAVVWQSPKMVVEAPTIGLGLGSMKWQARPKAPIGLPLRLGLAWLIGAWLGWARGLRPGQANH